MAKIVYNACFGGFGLSPEGLALYNQLSGKKETYGRHICRHDPHLVSVVEQLGGEASGFCADLQIEEITGNLYRIDEYDGSESVETPDRVEWIDVSEPDKKPTV